MARFLLAWELGGGLGHLVPLARLAQALHGRGHHVDLVLKDLSMVHEVPALLAGTEGLRVWQAPVWQPSAIGLPEPASHAEMLFRVGYLDAAGLWGLVRAWRQLLDACAPDLLVTEHAPTALLSARGLPMRVATLGHGFFIPPAGRPMPGYRSWELIPSARLEAAESRVLASCNEVLGRCGAPPLPALEALFATDESFLLGWPELDHFADERGPVPMRCWGPLASSTSVAAGGLWPPRPGRRIVAYLQRVHPEIEAVLRTLQAGPGHTLLHLAGVTPAEAAALGNAHLRVEARPIDLPAALAEADLLLGHAGPASVYQALQAGVPTVMLPLQAEQMLFARRVVAAGAGVLLWPEEVASGLERALGAVAGSVGFRQAACSLAQRHPGDALPAIVERCEALATRIPDPAAGISPPVLLAQP